MSAIRDLIEEKLSTLTTTKNEPAQSDLLVCIAHATIELLDLSSGILHETKKTNGRVTKLEDLTTLHNTYIKDMQEQQKKTMIIMAKYAGAVSGLTLAFSYVFKFIFP